MDIHKEVRIPVTGATLSGRLSIPHNAHGLVIFSHGSGSSMNSPRNKMVALRLEQNGIGTLLFDLLTQEEDTNYYNRFDIQLLTKRLLEATKWLTSQPEAQGLQLGFFGASTGAASALKAAKNLPYIKAIVSRGGRPDLAMDALSEVSAPTLLIVGSLDYDVLLLNQKAYDHLKCDKKLKVIEGASHLFEERDTLNEAATEAIKWFQQHLQPIEELHK